LEKTHRVHEELLASIQRSYQKRATGHDPGDGDCADKQLRIRHPCRLNPGNYTAIMSGMNATGVGLVEAYDLP
jgi:hypothetical protein